MSNPIIKWVFSESPRDTYLVGGYLRDILVLKKSSDIDFVLKDNADKIARKASMRFNGSYVELQKNHTFRVALKDRRFIDFSFMQDNIIMNLKERDFTVNAVAWSPDSGIVDPNNHLSDIKSKIIRAVAVKNLLADPLRILRAYRISSYLGFEIEKDTRKSLNKYSHKLSEAAPERITEEFFKILNNRNLLFYLKLCFEDNVISSIITITSSNFNILFNKLRKFEYMLATVNKSKNNRKLKLYLNSEISQQLKTSGLIRLYYILRYSGKYFKKNKKYYSALNGKSVHLTLSKRIRKSLASIYSAEHTSIYKDSKKRQYEMFKRAGDNLLETAIINALNEDADYKVYFRLADIFQKSNNNPLMNGNEIKEVLNIESGKLIGELKEKIIETQFYGNIKNKREARNWLLSNLT